MSTANILLKSVSVRSINYFVQVAASLIMTPLIVRSLGDRFYGLWIVVGTFLGYYGLLDFGLSSAATRFFSKALGQEDYNELNSVFSTTLFLFANLALVTLVLSACAAFATPIFFPDKNEASLFREIISVMGIGIALSFPVKAFEGLLCAYLRFDVLAGVNIIKTILMNLALYIYLKNGYGIFVVSIINVCGNLLECILITYLTILIAKSLKFKLSSIRKANFSYMFNYGGVSLIGQLADIVRFRLDSMVIASCVTLGMVAPYAIGQRLVEYFTQLMVTLFGMLFPVFSRQEARKDFDQINQNFRIVTKLSTLVSAYVGITMLIYGKQFISLWIGSEYEKSFRIMSILTVSYMVAHMQNPSISLMFGLSKHKYFVIANICEGILNLLLSLILVQKFGIVGVATGTAVAMLFFKLLIQPFYVCKKIINIDLIVYYRDLIFLPASKICAVMALPLFFVNSVSFQSVAELALYILTQTVLVLPLLTLLVFPKEQLLSLRTALLTR